MATALVKYVDESRLYDFVLSTLLQPGEVVESVDSLAASGLTISGAAVNAAPVVYEDGTVAAVGEVVQVRIGGGEAGTTYTVRGKVQTSQENTIVFEGELEVLA